MSPTAQAVLTARATLDAAIRAAWEAEGTDQEIILDAVERAAEATYREACAAHRAHHRAPVV